ncbi:coproporphyrinogen III oxidase [Pelomonas sp. Root1217]|uniref:radical SAM family heme chaperone HemW n=1 Tax=Pelomonas sp. Root1217 TaxID=1736430 RepID=UPI00070E35CA|nr:radical SAM family heme chaperone HemW [Pelomonas sp. Root1217]KQV48548.1 coproporphyrinogen III oxidase [Pelomonas sp. Root1217]
MAELLNLMRPGTLQLPALPPLALYVHLPWCLRKCPYCDFNSHEVKDGALAIDTAEAYLAALRADLEAALPLIWGRHVISIFIGGGTPSLFNPEQIAQLISDIRARLPLEPGCEITLEANPGTFERERFKGFRQAGVTRLSVGVQSFDDTQLKTLGRVHSATQAREALTEAAAAFETFNLDLMYALPGQTLDDLSRELDEALSFNPPHLSIYHLTIEPNTVFATRTPEHLPDPDLASDMLDLITARTGAIGLSRYEVSAYAREGHRCLHNLNYWQFGDYLGIGAGAHSKLSFPNRVLRQVRWREPAAFVAQVNKVSNEHEVARKDLPFEFMLNALRLKEGVTLTQFLERTGLPVSSIAKGLETARGRGMLTDDKARIQPTERGFDFLSDLQQLFL